MFLRKWFKTNKPTKTEQSDQKMQVPIKLELDHNLQLLHGIYEECSDVVFRRFSIAGKIDAALIFIEGLSNNEEIDANVLAPLMQKATPGELIQPKELIKDKIPIAKFQEMITIADCVEQISTGNPVILIEQEQLGLALGLAKWEQRSVSEPTSESVVRGPRDGFTETIGVNTSLIRRKLKSPQLKMKSIKVGRYTQTQVVIAYIENIADKNLIEEVTARLKHIVIDSVLESGYIEEMIEDNPFSPFLKFLAPNVPM